MSVLIEQLSIIADLVSSLFAAIAAGVALVALNSWRIQLKHTNIFKMALDLEKDLLKFLVIISVNPNSKSMADLSSDLQFKALAFKQRDFAPEIANNILEFITNLRISFQDIGTTTEKLNSDLLKCINELTEKINSDLI